MRAKQYPPEISNRTCRICGVALATGVEKQQHLRLHCVVCCALLDSRERLLEHMRIAHAVRIEDGAVSPFWEITHSRHADPLDEGSWGDEFGDYEESQDLSEYWIGHSE